MPLVGTNVAMVGGPAKVAGELRYIADLEFPGLLHVKALRSPYPHARLQSIDTSRAARMPGVCAVATRDDLADLNPCFGTGVEDQPVVAVDRVRYAGDIVAAVAAETVEIAEQAIELIEARYEELPASATIAEAIRPDAAVIQEKHVDPAAGGNIHGVYHARDGDVEAGFAAADHVLENVYTLPSIQHGHIEPHGVVACWEAGGKLVVHTPCQTPSPLQEQLAKVFKLSLNRVRVIVPPVGGGYGGKNHARIEPLVALLARKAQQPVRWILTREEVFLTGRRFGALVKIKTGFMNDGRLVARRAEVFYDMGAYALSGPANTKNACTVAPDRTRHRQCGGQRPGRGAHQRPAAAPRKDRGRLAAGREGPALISGCPVPRPYSSAARRSLRRTARPAVMPMHRVAVTARVMGAPISVATAPDWASPRLGPPTPSIR